MDDLHPDSTDADTATISSGDGEDTNDSARLDESQTHVTVPVVSADAAQDTANASTEASAEETSAKAAGVSESESPSAAEEETTPDAIAQDAASAAADPQAPVAQEAQASQEVTDMPPPAASAVAADDISMQKTMPPPVVTYSKVKELGKDGWGRILLAWRNDPLTTNGQEPPVVLLERTQLDADAAREIVEQHLYHARLLAPRAVVQREDDIHWLVVEAPASYEEPFTAISDGGALDPRSALKAGVGLANALSYLHANGITHGGVGPNSILVHDGRAYLSGIERGSFIDSADANIPAKISTDVNALASALVQLAGLPAQPATDEAAPEQAIRAIVARGAQNGYATSEDLAQDCGQALQEPALTLPAVDENAAGALVFRTGTATTVGLLRSQNQDALGSAVLSVRDDVGKDMPLGIFLVADGMGGEAAGEVASRIGARIAMAELLRQLLVPTVAMPALDPLSAEHTTGSISVEALAQALAIAVDAANRKVRELAAALQESTGTTLTVIVAAGKQAVLAHLGDSRAYLLRDGKLVQLTKDHSLLARLTELDHPLLNDPSFGMPRNYLYRSLGQEDEAPPDMLEFPVVPGDRLMLCCDGLWDELDDATIQRSLTSSDDPSECANHLVRLANAAGGHDNSTAVVVFVESQPDDPASEISPEEAEAILRSTGAFDDDDEGEEDPAMNDDLSGSAFDAGESRAN